MNFRFWILDFRLRGSSLDVQSKIQNRKSKIPQLVLGLIMWLVSVRPLAAQQTVDHAPWDGLMRRYVKGGLVDYQGLQRERAVLDQYLAQLTGANPDALPSTQEKLAFWANAYNACVVKGVLDHYPLTSVKDVKGFFDGVRFPAGGQSLTLNQLEAKGRALGDWRIHFAVVCASSSCPILRAEAYVPERLEQQLTEQVGQFLRDPIRGLRVDEVKRMLWVSKIFKWYAKDFVRQGALTSETLLLVLHRYLDASVLEEAQRRPLALNFLEYDWTLNDQARQTSP